MAFRSLAYSARRNIFALSGAVHKHHIRPQAFFDVQIGNQKPKRLLFELYGDILPATIQQLSKLLGEAGQTNGATLKGTEFARIIPSLYALTGEFPRQGGVKVEDLKIKNENFEVSHDQEGLISLVNNEGSATSQLLITLGPVDWFDTKYTVFGKLLEGVEVLNEIELAGSIDGKVNKKVVIQDCGKITPVPALHDPHHHDAHHHH